MVGDDRTLRVVILPDAPSTAPLVDLLRALVVQRLIDPPILLVDNAMDARRLGFTPEEDELRPLRHHIESARCQRFLLVNLVTADAMVSVPGPVTVGPPTPSLVPELSDPVPLSDFDLGEDRQAESDDAVVDAAPVAPELRAAFTVDAFIRNALAFKFESSEGGSAQRLDVVNLVVPAAQAGSMPTHLHSRGPKVAANVSGWANVVVAPEIQSTSLQAVVPVVSNEEYVAHVGSALITVAGCWAGATWEPEFPSFDPDMWTVVRGRSRSMVAPELPVRVLARIGGSANKVPVSDDVEYFIAPDAQHASDLAKHQMIKRHDLTLKPFVDVQERSTQQVISIMDFFRMLRAWITGTLPSIVMNEARERVRTMGDTVDKRINKRAGLDEKSQFRIRFLGRAPKEKSEVVEDEADTFEHQNWRFVAAEPAVWSSLRDLSFGLLDGGNVHDDEVTALLGHGGQRYVLGDQRLISPPPDVALWAPSEVISAMGIGPGPVRSVVDVEWAARWTEALRGLIEELKASIAESGVDLGSIATAEQSGTNASEGSGDRTEADAAPDDGVDAAVEAEPGGDNDGAVDGASTGMSEVQLLRLAERDLAGLLAARKMAGRSLLWGLGEHLFTQYHDVIQHLADLRAQKEKAEEEAADLDAINQQGKKSKRRELVRLLITMAALVVVGVGAYFGVKYAALSGIALVLTGIVIAILWLAALVRSLWRCVRSWFLAEHHMHWLRQGRVEVLEQAILFEDAQMRRFSYLCTAEREWSDLIATICYHPFRRPTIDSFQRVREPDLGLTSSFQVVEGYTTEPRLEGITASVAAELIRPGWLSTTFHSALEYAKEEHDLRTRGGTFQPDEDVTGASDRIGPRKALVDATVSGRARQRREMEVLSRIHTAIRTGIGFKQNPMEADQAVEDRLFTPWSDHVLPSGFLREPIEGTPSNFNREFIPIAALPIRLASAVKQEVALPRPPTIEEIVEGATVDFPPLVFGAWAIETASGIPMADLTFFADEATPAELDLEVALTRWIPPPDECLGTISIRSPEDREGWVLDAVRLADVASFITPNPDSRPQTGRGSYRFLVQQDGEPLAHPAGVPIKFAVRSDVAPPGADDLVARALQAIADRTGHEFELDGTFTGLPDRTASRIEIAWAFDDEFQKWEVAAGKAPGTAVGWGGPFGTTGARGQQVLVGGFALLNADMDCEVGFLPGASHGNVLLHELGHVMNLSHVDDAREIMRPQGYTVQSALDYGPGDTQGLHVLRDAASRVIADAIGAQGRLAS